MRFLRRALEEDAPASLRRSALLDLGAAESAAQMPEAAGRMEEAQRLSSDPGQHAQAALGLSMVRFLAADLPGAVAACEDVLAEADRLERELRLGLEFQAASTRLVGGMPSPETFVRLLELEPQVSRGETAAERSLLAMMAVVFAATTARTADEVAALAETAWGDGQLLVEVRSEHPALAAPASAIALTAATVAIALTGRLSRAVEVSTAGVEEARARSSMLLYSNALGLRASAREWSGDLGGAEADAVAALALLPADDPIVLPTVLSALTDVYIERGAPDAATALLRDSWPPGELPQTLSVSQALASRGRLALRMGDARAALADLQEAGRRALAIAYVNPMALMWRSYAALAAARLGERDQAHELIAEELEIARRFGAPEPIGEALRVRALLAPSADMADLAREAADVLAGSELRVAHARALIDLGAALRRRGHRRDARAPLREGLDLANRCGSLLETDRALDELRAAGARPRRPALRGCRRAVHPGTPGYRARDRRAQQPRDRRSAASSAAGRSRCTSPAPTASSTSRADSSYRRPWRARAARRDSREPALSRRCESPSVRREPVEVANQLAAAKSTVRLHREGRDPPRRLLGAHDQARRAEGSADLLQLGRAHRHHLGRGRQRVAPDRLLDAVDQRRTGWRQLAADDRRLRVERVAHRRQRLADHQACIHEHAAGAGVAVTGQTHDVPELEVRTVYRLQPLEQAMTGGQRIDAAAPPAAAHRSVVAQRRVHELAGVAGCAVGATSHRR